MNRIKRLFFKTTDEADRWFQERESQLRNLAQHSNFHVLKEWWELEYDRADREIDALVGKDGLDEAILERKVIRKHLDWISNLTT